METKIKTAQLHIFHRKRIKNGLYFRFEIRTPPYTPNHFKDSNNNNGHAWYKSKPFHNISHSLHLIRCSYIAIIHSILFVTWRSTQRKPSASMCRRKLNITVLHVNKFYSLSKPIPLCQKKMFHFSSHCTENDRHKFPILWSLNFAFSTIFTAVLLFLFCSW